MELEKAIKILEYHQEWRLGKKDKYFSNPKELTQALDTVIQNVKDDNLISKAKQMESEQFSIYNDSDSEYDRGVLIGIERIVKLIERHHEKN